MTNLDDAQTPEQNTQTNTEKKGVYPYIRDDIELDVTTLPPEVQKDIAIFIELANGDEAHTGTPAFLATRSVTYLMKSI